MRLITLLILFITVAPIGHAQSATDSSTNHLFERLIQITDLPHDQKKKQICGDNTYWDIVKEGISIIPTLIETLTDTTITSFKIPCRETYLRVGDVSFLLLNEIISVPIARITQNQFDLQFLGCDFGQSVGLFDYLAKNRVGFNRQLREWFNTYRSIIKKRELSQKEKSSCRAIFGINYCFEIEY
jgi:hypothetical protein